jgi:hypothetical protein
MDPIDKATLERIYASLPEEIRELLAAPETYAAIDTIAAKYGIDGVERGLLSQATSRILLGTLKPNEYVATIIRYLDIDQSQAALIAQEINRDIFNPIKERLKELHGTEKQASDTMTEATTASAATPTKMAEPAPARPAFVVPRPSAEPAPKAPSILESKLGSAFTVRKDPLPSATPIAPVSPAKPSVSSQANPTAPAVAPAVSTPQPPLRPLAPTTAPTTTAPTRSVAPAQTTAAPAAPIPPIAPIAPMAPASAPVASVIPTTKTSPSIASPMQKLGLTESEKAGPATAPVVSLPTTKPADPYREAV